MIGNLHKMRFQYEWRGPRIINTRILIHEDELDIPQRQLGSPALLGPDPVPVANARIEQYSIDEYPVSTRYTMSGAVRVIMQHHGASPINLIATVQGGVVDGTR
jgi:hemin uptake protein HemP